MTRNLSRVVLLSTSLLFLFSTNTRSAVYWATAGSIPGDQGVRPRVVSVCFVGDALTSRPERVKEILRYIKEFEYAANVRFEFLGTCPPPTELPGGGSYHEGDIRVVIPGISVNGTGQVPDVNCPMFRDADGNYNGENDGWGSWSNAPWDLPTHRGCLYNLKLGDDPWPVNGNPAGNPPSTVPYLNHTLHEFGHALGLAHEHERNDVDSRNCTAQGYGGGIGNGLLTLYDRDSVMHYQFLQCGINGNYDDTGLSDLDRIALHILYPEDNQVAEFVGTTVVRAGSELNLQSAWMARGANIGFTAKNFTWRLSGKNVSTAARLRTKVVGPGNYELRFSHEDFLGRRYSYTGRVHAIAPAAYNNQVAASLAASLPLR